MIKHYIKDYTGLNKVEITKSDFTEIKKAKDNIDKFNKIVNNYRVVIEAYRNIELAKHEAEIDHILYSRHGYENFVDARVMLSSPIISYLSSSRFFIDSSHKILKDILSDQDYSSFSSYVNEIYDESEEYRFIEAIRNYVQHRDLPIHKTTYHNFHDDNSNFEASGMVTSLSLFINKEELKDDDQFKKSVLNEIPERVNIVYYIRCHMERIWKQFDFIKETIIEVGNESRSVIQKAIDDFKKKTESKIISLYAIAKEEEKNIENVPLVIEWYDANKESIRNLGNLNNLHKRYVTGKIIKK